MRAVCALFSLLMITSPTVGGASSFPLPDGTTWCFLGDSITSQNYHINYIEAYYHLRFPQYRYHFRGCGRGGSTLPEALNRFDPDVAIWTPDVVSLEMGLNGNATKAEFIANLHNVSDETEALGAESVYFSLHPLHQANGGNNHLHDRADAFVEVSTARGLVAVDQFYDLKPIFTANAVSPNPVDLGYPSGDTGHPGPAGHMIKTWDILTSMGAPAEVSSASFDASSGALVSSSYCAVTNVTKTATGVSFSRVDDRMPIAFDPEGLAALELVPTLLDDISAYMLEVDGLAPGFYRIIIDGVESAGVNALELADGYNMSEMTAGPIHEQLQLVRQMIRDKEGYNVPGEVSVVKRRLAARYYRDLYGFTQAELIAYMADMVDDILPMDEAIHNASQPAPHDFEIELAAGPGDANADLKVDIVDLTAVAANWSSLSPGLKTWAQGDFNNNKIVDIEDLTALSANWSFVGSRPVPEPATPMLLGLGALCLLRRRSS